MHVDLTNLLCMGMDGYRTVHVCVYFLLFA